MTDKLILAAITCKGIANSIIAEALYEHCDRLHACSCTECLVYKHVGGIDGDCPYHKNGAAMLAVLSSTCKRR